MSRPLLIVLLAGALLAALLLPAAALPAPFEDSDFRTGDYTVDSGHSSAVFSILHLGVARFYGRFNVVNGSFHLDLEEPSKSSVLIEIDAASVDTNDEGRDRHAASAELLDAEKHPKLSFVSSSVRRVSDKLLEVSGELSLRGITKQLTTEVELVGASQTFFNDFRSGVEARFAIDRTDFGINGVQGGLGNRIEFIVSLEGVLAEAESDGD